jgi:hypothetical protein
MAHAYQSPFVRETHDMHETNCAGLFCLAG